MKYLEVRDSSNGKGIFVLKGFISNEAIYEVRGQLISCNEDDEVEQSIRDNTFRFDEEKYLSPQGELGDFQNHSCEPNAGVFKINKNLFIVAICDIEIGEEVLIDYSTILASDDVWEMKCHCGAKVCRKIIKQFRTLPQTIQDTYLLLNVVPPYILN